jgi:hypothetical protein
MPPPQDLNANPFEVKDWIRKFEVSVFLFYQFTANEC